MGIKMDDNEIGWEVLEWIHMACDQDQWQTFLNLVKGSKFIE
jgi:hypothetical protein